MGGSTTENTVDLPTHCGEHPAAGCFLTASELAELSPDPLLLVDSHLKVVWANAAVEDVFGWDRCSHLGSLDLLSIVHPDDLASVALSAQSVTDKESGTLLELRVRAASGHWRLVEVRGRPVGNVHGAGILISVRDLSDRHGWDMAAGDSDVLRVVVESSSTPVLICEPDLTVRSASAALPRVLGHDRESVNGASLLRIVDDDHRCATEALFDPAGPSRRVGDVAMIDIHGRSHPFRLEVTDLCTDPVVAGFVVFAYDTGDLHAALDEAARAARTDPLTGLANRSTFMEELRSRLERPDTEVGVLFVDLDGFKAVNDLLGHHEGDRLLCGVAARLSAAVRDDDVVARLGGDEFVVVFDVDDDDADVSTVLCERVESAVVRTAPGDPVVAASVGVVVRSGPAVTAEELLAEADAEMYRAKAWRRGLDVLPATVPERRRMAAELAAAFDGGEIVTYFQPIVDLESSSPVGVEALVRWEHPLRGVLVPADFLAVCEEAGFEGRLAEVVISSAARFLSRAPSGIWVSVNLSPLQLGSAKVRSMLRTAVDGRDASSLVVEVTERAGFDAVTSDGSTVLDVLCELRSAGFGVALDEIGTGPSSLSKLTEMPATMMKLDHRLTARAGADPGVTAVVGAITTVATVLGFPVVAEGVESAEQAATMKSSGCSLAQGWLFGAPAPLGVALEAVSGR